MCRPILMNHNCGGDHEGLTVAIIRCALCSGRAAIYCHADSAFLCRDCDKSVHGANILALRHIRSVVCGTCQRFKGRYVVGVSTEVVQPALVRAVRRWAARNGCGRRRLGYEEGDRYELSLSGE